MQASHTAAFRPVFIFVRVLSHCGVVAGNKKTVSFFSPSPGSKGQLAEGTLTTPGPRPDPSLPARLWRHYLQDPYTDGICLFTCTDESTMSLGVKD